MSNVLRIKPSMIVSLLLLTLACTVLWVAQGYDRSSAIFPIFIGRIFVGLVLLEVTFEIRKMFLASCPSLSVDTNRREHGSSVVWKEVKGFLWLAAFLLSLYLVGFVVSIPLYIFSFLRFSSGRKFAESFLITFGVSAFIYVMFIFLLGYDLQGGVLFES